MNSKLPADATAGPDHSIRGNPEQIQSLRSKYTFDAESYRDKHKPFLLKTIIAAATALIITPVLMRQPALKAWYEPIFLLFTFLLATASLTTIMYYWRRYFLSRSYVETDGDTLVFKRRISNLGDTTIPGMIALYSSRTIQNISGCRIKKNTIKIQGEVAVKIIDEEGDTHYSWNASRAVIPLVFSHEKHLLKEIEHLASGQDRI